MGSVWLLNVSFTGLVEDRVAHLLTPPFMCPCCSNPMATHIRYQATTENQRQAVKFPSTTS